MKTSPASPTALVPPRVDEDFPATAISDFGELEFGAETRLWRFVHAVGDWVRARPALDPAIERRLTDLYENAPRIHVPSDTRVLILSDLHIGNGGRRDDFHSNAAALLQVLEQCHERNYHLVLNGDIEELQNFSLPSIVAAWPRFYRILERFHQANRLTKLLGNHDASLSREHSRYPLSIPLHHAVRLSVHGQELFVFHGHQASNWQVRLGPAAGLLVRWVFSPIGFRNKAQGPSSDSRIRLEQQIYEFARRRGLVVLNGHTHRPLFESLSKIDSLKYRIEHLCREFAAEKCPQRRGTLEERIREAHGNLRVALRRRGGEGSLAALYHDQIVVPCLFNSGCAIGKRGFTGIEIAGGNMELVHWFRRSSGLRYFLTDGPEPKRCDSTEYYRTILRKDCLTYIASRSRLLT